jgi:hypothetical protein
MIDKYKFPLLAELISKIKFIGPPKTQSKRINKALKRFYRN